MSENKVPVSQSSSWTAFLKSIASYNGDLASLTAPPFILSPVSVIEYSRFWAENPDLFVAPSQEEDEEERVLKVLKWFIATLRGQYCSRNEKLGSEKKPLNPFLGEVFTGSWQDEIDGDSILVSEQVSHHPPVTAYSIWNDKNDLYLEGYNGIKSSLGVSTISVKQYGHALLHLKRFSEQFLVTLPALHIEGIIYGAPYVELEGKSFIQSTSGYKITIEYSGKGYFSGKKNTFKAKIIRNSDPTKVLYSISGQWSGISTIKNELSGESEQFLNSNDVSTAELIVKPEEQQNELESRRAWSKVAAAIREGNYDLIHQEKSKIENEQRELRKKEQAEGIEWKRRWFEKVLVKDEPNYEELSALAGVVAGTAHNSSSTTTSGSDRTKDTNWRFVRSKYEEGDIKA